MSLPDNMKTDLNELIRIAETPEEQIGERTFRRPEHPSVQVLLCRAAERGACPHAAETGMCALYGFSDIRSLFTQE
jgi:hypothetical protein